FEPPRLGQLPGPLYGLFHPIRNRLAEAFLEADHGRVGQALSQQAGVEVSVFLQGFNPATALRLPKVSLQEREVDAYRRRMREPLVLVVVNRRHLRLAIIVDQDEPLPVNQSQQALQGLQGTMAMQDSPGTGPGKGEGKVAIGYLLRI